MFVPAAAILDDADDVDDALVAPGAHGHAARHGRLLPASDAGCGLLSLCCSFSLASLLLFAHKSLLLAPPQPAPADTAGAAGAAPPHSTAKPPPPPPPPPPPSARRGPTFLFIAGVDGTGRAFTALPPTAT